MVFEHEISPSHMSGLIHGALVKGEVPTARSSKISPSRLRCSQFGTSVPGLPPKSDIPRGAKRATD